MYQNDGLITLLISCPDQPGIVAAISRFIFEHQGNIIHSDQHSTHRHGGTFFMRIAIRLVLGFVCLTAGAIQAPGQATEQTAASKKAKSESQQQPPDAAPEEITAVPNRPTFASTAEMVQRGVAPLQVEPLGQRFQLAHVAFADVIPRLLVGRVAEVDAAA